MIDAHAGGRTLRGRRTVVAELERAPDEVVPPASVELRDGQIYRWAEA